jgi:signal transduction histidine kinase
VSAGVSVSRRLFFLVACQTVIAALLVLLGLQAIAGLGADYRHMYEFQLQSIYDIRKAIEEARSLEAGSRSSQLDAFYQRYRSKWEIASGSTPDAVRFRQDLQDMGEQTLQRQEADLLTRLRESLEKRDVQSVQTILAALYDVNLRYARLANRRAIARIKSGRMRLFAIGIIGAALTLFLGLHVRRAIAPRIQRLVAYVRQFQKGNGNFERLTESGNDDIAVLTNALNAGFSAIAMREKDHERFLAVAAHELKTPVTSIHGYASLLVTHPQQAPHVFRALEVIDRQSWRLSKLIETLFLAMQARSGDLRFDPRPLDLSQLVARVMREMEPFLAQKTSPPRIDQGICILGDEGLLEHALWSLLTCASRLTARNSLIQVSLYIANNTIRLSAEIEKSDVPIEEVQELFIPLRAMEYETGTGIRSAVGLYLCREIMRVHNGQLSVQQPEEKSIELAMEFPK